MSRQELKGWIEAILGPNFFIEDYFIPIKGKEIYYIFKNNFYRPYKGYFFNHYEVFETNPVTHSPFHIESMINEYIEEAQKRIDNYYKQANELTRIATLNELRGICFFNYECRELIDQLRYSETETIERMISNILEEPIRGGDFNFHTLTVLNNRYRLKILRNNRLVTSLLPEEILDIVDSMLEPKYPDLRRVGIALKKQEQQRRSYWISYTNKKNKKF